MTFLLSIYDRTSKKLNSCLQDFIEKYIIQTFFCLYILLIFKFTLLRLQLYKILETNKKLL